MSQITSTGWWLHNKRRRRDFCDHQSVREICLINEQEFFIPYYNTNAWYKFVISFFYLVYF